MGRCMKKVEAHRSRCTHFNFFK